jgi:hypothetical protein
LQLHVLGQECCTAVVAAGSAVQADCSTVHSNMHITGKLLTVVVLVFNWPMLACENKHAGRELKTMHQAFTARSARRCRSIDCN